MKDRLFTVTGGQIEKASRTTRGSSVGWKIRVAPADNADVTLTARATTDCTAQHAACDASGRKFDGNLTATVTGPQTLTRSLPVVSIAAPATTPVTEGTALAFTLTRTGATDAALTVNVSVTESGATLGASPPTTVTFAAHSPNATLSAPTVDDTTVEAASTVTATVSAGTGYTVAGDASSAEGVVESEDLEPITATWSEIPTEHDGSSAFWAKITFSHALSGYGFRSMQAHLFDVTGGRIVKARRDGQPRNTKWAIRIVPAGNGEVTLDARATADCGAAHAVCDAEGRKFDGNLAATLQGPPTLSVADAEVQEGPEAALDFTVTLSRAAGETVTVAYATADGTASAGEDYTATSGTLSFAADETEKTVSVAVLDDVLDEGAETMTLRLSNPSPARVKLADAEATGTIKNADPLQRMWLSRFGRTVADHVTGAVSDRLANPLSGGQVTVGGQTLSLAETGDETQLGRTLTSLAQLLGAPSGPATGEDPDGSGTDGWPGTGLGPLEPPARAGSPARLPEGGEVLLGSSFHLATDGERSGPGLAAWGRVTAGGFDGEAPADGGSVRIDGSVTTGILGADAEWSRLLAGVAVSVSEGEGTFSQPGVDAGTIESTMTTVSPYARLMVNERVSAWGLAGWGTGDMTVVQAANDRGQPERVSRTDLEMRLAALGGRGALMQADDAGGVDLALRADAFLVETESEAVSNEGSTTGEASRVRLALEGSRAFRMDGGGVFTPGLEVGLRHDGGDAETGTGVELGGRVSWSDPETGLGVEARVRTLIAHEDSGYMEWGASGSVRLDPGERGRGLSFSLAPTWGAASSGVGRLWSAQDARGLAPGAEFEAAQHLEGELGYGLSLFGDRFTGTPNVGFGFSDGARDYRIGWRLTSAVRGDAGFEVNLDATRRETANDNGALAGPGLAEHGVMLRGTMRW